MLEARGTQPEQEKRSLEVGAAEGGPWACRGQVRPFFPAHSLKEPFSAPLKGKEPRAGLLLGLGDVPQALQELDPECTCGG